MAQKTKKVRRTKGRSHAYDPRSDQGFQGTEGSRQPEFGPRPHGAQRKASSPRSSSTRLAGRNAAASQR